MKEQIGDDLEVTAIELRSAANTMRKVYVVLAEERSKWPWWKRFTYEYEDCGALIRNAYKFCEMAKKYDERGRHTTG